MDRQNNLPSEPIKSWSNYSTKIQRYEAAKPHTLRVNLTRGRVSLVVKSVKNQSKEKGKSKSKRDRKDEDLLFCPYLYLLMWSHDHPRI